MDPNANLQEQERILERYGAPGQHMNDRDRLRELRIALADWLNAGGFAPDWTACPRAARYYDRQQSQLERLTGARKAEPDLGQ